MRFGTIRAWWWLRRAPEPSCERVERVLDAYKWANENFGQQALVVPGIERAYRSESGLIVADPASWYSFGVHETGGGWEEIEGVPVLPSWINLEFPETNNRWERYSRGLGSTLASYLSMALFGAHRTSSVVGTNPGAELPVYAQYNPHWWGTPYGFGAYSGLVMNGFGDIAWRPGLVYERSEEQDEPRVGLSLSHLIYHWERIKTRSSNQERAKSTQIFLQRKFWPPPEE